MPSLCASAVEWWAVSQEVVDYLASSLNSNILKKEKKCALDEVLQVCRLSHI